MLRRTLEQVLQMVGRISRWPVLALLLAMVLVFVVVLMPMLVNLPGISTDATPPLDLLFRYSPQTAFAHIESVGQSGRGLSAVMHLTLDVAYPIVYSFLFAVILFMSSRYVAKSVLWSRRVKWVPILPFSILDFDVLENLGISIMMWRWPEQSVWLAQLTSFATSAKWTLVALTLGLILVFLVLASAKRIRN